MKITCSVPAPGGTLRFAAEELERFLAQVPLSVSFQLRESMGEDEYSIAGETEYLLSGGSETALLYAAYHLLKELGFCFLGPDPWDTVIPEKIVLPALDIHTSPRFPWRGFFAVEKRDTPEFLLWMVRNGMNFWSLATKYPELCRKFGFKLRANPPSGTHRLFEDYLNPEQYFSSHPEYYAWDGEKRNSSMVPVDAWNICTSNPQAADQLVQNLIRELNPGGALESASSISFAPFDNGHWCRCENCKKQGNRTTRFLLFADRCSKAIRKAVKRPVYLVVPAYHETLMTPDRPLPEGFDYERIIIEFFPIERCYAHKIDDPSCEANALLMRFLKAWAELKTFRFFVCEYYNVSTFASAAIPLDKGMEHDLTVYEKAGAFGITYMHVSTAQWGQLALNNCAFAAAAWGEAFSRDGFLQKRYGEFAGSMKAFYGEMDAFTPLAKPVFHYLGTGKLNETGDNTVTHSIRSFINNETRPFDFGEHCDVQKMEHVRDCMLRAKESLDALPLPASGVLKERLDCDRMRFDYTLTRFRFTLAIVRACIAERKGDKETAKAAAADMLVWGEKLRTMKKAVQHIRETGAPNGGMYFNCLTASRLQQAYARTLDRYGLTPAPFLPEECVVIVQG